jgi:hypothetical protein
MTFVAFVNYCSWIEGSGLDDCNFHPEDVVVIHNDGFSAQYLRRFAYKMERPLTVQLVDEDGKNSLLQWRRQHVSEASITRYISRSCANYLYDRCPCHDGHI